MSRIYAVTTNVALGTGGAIDLLSVQPASNRPVTLRGYRLSQQTNISDANEKDIRVTVRRMGATFTVGSGGTAQTASAPLEDAGTTVWGATIRTGDTTVATTSGTNQVLDDNCWNTRNTPYEMWWPDKIFCPKAKNAEGLVVRLETTLGVSTTASLTFWFEEE
jgi:hypothetical protein